MRNKEIDYTWTRPEMRACVESRLHDLIVQPDGLSDDELISMIKKQLHPQTFIPMGLLSQHVHDEWEEKAWETSIGFGAVITLIGACHAITFSLTVPLALAAVQFLLVVGGAACMLARLCMQVHYFACTREVATEPEACEVLRERLQGLAEGVKEEGNRHPLLVITLIITNKGLGQ